MPRKNPGDLVLDCFVGSGTTLVAAEELGRQWIGADIGDEAIKVIRDRFANGTKPIGDYVSKKKRQTVDTSNSLFDNSCFETEAANDAKRSVEFQVLEKI